MGVGITDVPSLTLYGSAMSLQSGDIIVSINGQKVFGKHDLNQKLINHGLTRSLGVEVPVKYTVMRDGSFYNIENTYFFNESYSQNRLDQSGVAFWYGVGDALSFGQTPWVVCRGSNGVERIKEGVSAVWEFGKSWLQDRDYDSSNVYDADFIDAAECTWQKEQARALARQKEPDIYINSQWFVLFSPSAVRAIGTRTFRKHAAKALGRGTLSKAVADGVLEAAETALWSVGTAAPGSPLSTRLGEAARFAPLGAATGFVTTAALNWKSKR